jgi:tripeptide aminopeptidase
MQALIDKVIQLTIDIQQIPAPTFEESARAEFLREVYLKEGLDDVEIDSVGNLYGRIKGENADAAPLVICAHLDTVFPAETDLRIERHPNRVAAPGIGDNSLATAGMIGLLWLLREQKKTPLGDIWLVTTVGEEGLGDLYGMREVVNRFEDTPIAYLALEGMALGHIFHRALGVRRYRISAQTRGGHSWGHYGRPSAIHHLAKLIDELTSIKLPRRPRTTLNVGVFQGGTSINTIAAEAEFELDLRSESPEALAELVETVQSLVHAASKPNITVVAEQIGNRPAGGIAVSHPLVALAEAALIHVGIEPTLTIGSTDANIPLSRGYPAICLGISTGDGAHTLREFIDTRYIGDGLRQLVYLIDNLWG